MSFCLDKCKGGINFLIENQVADAGRNSSMSLKALSVVQKNSFKFRTIS